MYLITIARVDESGAEGPVSVSRVADDLGVSVPSVNEMIKKLAKRDLLVYEPYHGVILTPVGHRIADQVLRTRRLWATFLAEHLGFSPMDADAQACDLEHNTSPEAADRLAAFLGNPEAGPLGRPIPDGAGVSTRSPSHRLIEFPVGATVEVLSVTTAGSTLSFLSSEGIRAGASLTVAATGTSGLLIDLAGGSVHISTEIAQTIEVRKVGDSHAPA